MSLIATIVLGMQDEIRAQWQSPAKKKSNESSGLTKGVYHDYLKF